MSLCLTPTSTYLPTRSRAVSWAQAGLARQKIASPAATLASRGGTSR
ncbi:MAG: hypothetical protein U0836_26300 [Pirellulales bacterium]